MIIFILLLSSLMKMVVNFADNTKSLNRNQLEHSIRRNFGGFDPEKFDPMEFFEKQCNLETLEHQEDGRPPVDSIGLIQSSLSGEDTALEGLVSKFEFFFLRFLYFLCFSHGFIHVYKYFSCI